MSAPFPRQEGRLSSLAGSALALYRASRHPGVRNFVRKTILRLEGGPVYSHTIRQIYREFHGVDVGLYTIGPCDVPPGGLDPGTRVGRYSSIYYTVRAITSQDPSATLSADRLFPPEALGQRADPHYGTLTIGSDVWMGHNVILLPTVRSVGDGVVVGAGSVVHADIPPPTPSSPATRPGWFDSASRRKRSRNFSNPNGG